MFITGPVLSEEKIRLKTPSSLEETAEPEPPTTGGESSTRRRKSKRRGDDRQPDVTDPGRSVDSGNGKRPDSSDRASEDESAAVKRAAEAGSDRKFVLRPSVLGDVTSGQVAMS
jgi:hypothetical protein